MATYYGDLRELVDPAWSAQGTDAVYIYCPYHEDKRRPSMRVYSSGAHCFTCGVHLFRDQFSEMFSSRHQTASLILAAEQPRYERKRRQVEPGLLARLAHERLLEMPDKLEYLKNRGIDLGLVVDFQLGHYGPAYTIPVYDDDGCVNVRFRRDDSEAVSSEFDLGKYWGMRGCNPVLLYPHHGSVKEERVVITEGEFDALLLRNNNIAAYSFTNGNLAKLSADLLTLWFANVKEVTLVRDQDVAGRLGAKNLSTLLPTTLHGVKVVNLVWPCEWGKDVTELWQQRPDQFVKLTKVLTLRGFTI